MLTCIDVKLISDSVRLVLSSSVYSPNSRCRPPSCLLAAFAMLLALFRLVPDVVVTLQTSEMSAIFLVTNKTTQPRSPVAGCIFDVISSLNTQFSQIWSSVTGYGELCVCF